MLIQLFYSQELLAAMASERLLKSRSLSSAASTSLRFHENFDIDHVSSSNKSDNLLDLCIIVASLKINHY